MSKFETSNDEGGKERWGTICDGRTVVGDEEAVLRQHKRVDGLRVHATKRRHNVCQGHACKRMRRKKKRCEHIMSKGE